VGTPFTQWREISSRNTRGTKQSYNESPKSVPLLFLKRYRVVTDGQTDRQNYHS